ncbi:MAG: hypothetical protein GX045_04775 [Clostridiaceae bacterium]|nr:hypothetical protein [Clostridiaceae bacterium]
MIVLIKRLFNNKLSANWHYYIWFLLIIRLIMPYTPESSLSIYDLFLLHPWKLYNISISIIMFIYCGICFFNR